MRGFGYRRNNARDNTNWNHGAVVRCACGGILLPPPANYVYDPYGGFLPLQPQAQLQEMPDAVEGQRAPDLPLPPDPTTVVGGGGPGQSITAAPQPQPNSSMQSPEAVLAPLQTSSARIDAPVASVQQPAGDRPLQPSSGGGGAGSSRRRRRYRTNKDRTVTRVQDGAPPAADAWAWRKYGQKAIKGSQYLRSYYRCSTDKNCPARKYVDRCNNGSRCMIFSYSGEHSHAMPLVHNGVNGGTSSEMPPLPPSPLVNVPAVVEEMQQDPAPPPAIASASSSPPTPPPRSPLAELNVEDYRDTMAVTMMLKDDDKPQEDLQFVPAPEELAPVHHGGALGSGRVDNNNHPITYENAAGSGSSNGDGSRMSAPVQDPVANVVNETFFCLQPWDDSLFDWV